MQSLTLPAGAAVRFSATARAHRGPHLWNLRVINTDGGAVRFSFGSWIGGLDLHQSLDIPAQDADCRLEVECHHQTLSGLAQDRPSRGDDTPERLQIGFTDASAPGSQPDDLLLSFVFDRSAAGPVQASLA